MAVEATRFAPAERASEDELLRQIAVLQGQSLLQEVLATVPDLLLILNRHRQVLFANHVLADRLGLSEDDIRGLRPGEVLGCVNATRGAGGCGTSEACSTCGAVAAILDAVGEIEAEKEARLTLKSGESLDLRVRTRPVRVEGENLIVMSLRDIADEKRRRVLEQVFFHDVLNTAGGVVGLAELLRYADTDTADNIGRMLQASAERLVEEIRAQELVAAAENQDYEPVVSEVAPAAIVDDVVNTFVPLAQDAGVTLRVAGDLPQVTVETDRTLLGRVLGNLVKNAIEASAAGMTVAVGVRTEGGQVEFWVHNETVMPGEARLQVFQRSFSTKGEGRGVGTYSVRLFTECYLSGTVGFESGDEGGTVFRVRLPLAWN